MKRFFSGMFLSLVLVFSLALSSFASDITKTFTLTRDSKIKGQHLPKGTYSVKFSGDKEGELVLMQGKKEVLRVPYKFTQLNESPGDDKVAYTVADDGSFTVKRIEFKGLKSAIVLEEGTIAEHQ
jgi:hypothetical protein